MSQVSTTALLIGVLLLGSAGARAAEPDLAKTPLGMEIQRGDEALSTKCMLKPPESFDACASASREEGINKSINPAAFDLGFYFSLWFSKDVLVNPDPTNGPLYSHPDPNGPAWKPLAIKYYQAYVDARKKTGLTDDQVLVLEHFDPKVLKRHLEVAAHGY